MSELPQKIKKLGFLNGFSQAELARRIGMLPCNLNVYLKGKGDIRSERFVQIMSALGIDVEEVLDHEILTRDPDNSVRAKDASFSVGRVSSKMRKLSQGDLGILAVIVDQLLGPEQGMESVDGILQRGADPDQCVQQDVFSALRKNFEFSLFFVAPEVIRDVPDWRDMAKMVGIPEEVARGYRDQLVSAGLWEETADRIEKKATTYMDLGDLEISEFRSSLVNIISRLSPTGPCRYETVLVPTTRALKIEFYRKIDKAFREFIEATERASQLDCILAWAQAGVECLSQPILK